MPELTQQAGRIWMAALAEHLASVLTPLLPSDRELVATGAELAVMIRREGAPLKVALTFPLPTPGEAPVLDAETVDEVFRDLQDEIVLHLGETWPTAPDGRVLRARARETDGAVGLGFEPTSGDPAQALALEVFVPPSVEGPRAAG
ncbi:hypothetical protein ACQPX6_29800 [Actinomycetospora sp. CA-101289]|uniref:hypothetical protein n=1 Tax=Actinomycetospora sp. CA-101289 TaxID=3239893 RepID=UPI003D98535B